MGDVTYLHETTDDEIPVDRVLEGVPSEEMSSVLVVGWKKADGGLYAASSTGEAGELLVLIELFKRAVIDAHLDD